MKKQPFERRTFLGLGPLVLAAQLVPDGAAAQAGAAPPPPQRGAPARSRARAGYGSMSGVDLRAFYRRGAK